MIFYWVKKKIVLVVVDVFPDIVHDDLWLFCWEVIFGRLIVNRFLIWTLYEISLCFLDYLFLMVTQSFMIFFLFGNRYSNLFLFHWHTKQFFVLALKFWLSTFIDLLWLILFVLIENLLFGINLAFVMFWLRSLPLISGFWWWLKIWRFGNCVFLGQRYHWVDHPC